MADALFRIPSRAITYGYVEIQVPSEEGASPEMLAAQYVSYVYAFQKEEQATVDRLAKGLSAPQGVSQGETGQGDRDEGDGQHEVAQELLKKELGATEVDARDGVAQAESAPWNKKVEPKAKPWEKKAKPTVDVGDDW